MSGRLAKLEVHLNFVVIEDDIVNRPPYLSVGQWLDLWEAFKEVNEGVSAKKVISRYVGQNA